MKKPDILVDAFGRIREEVHDVLTGLTQEQLAFRIGGQANSIAWLIWHLTRVQDDHVADAAGDEQLWTGEGWEGRFGLLLPPGSTGYGHSSAEVSAVGLAPADLLLGYHDAVHERTVQYVRGLTGPDLDRIVDKSWDPPVSLGVRLVSVVSDDLEHAGQAAFVRGIVLRQ